MYPAQNGGRFGHKKYEDLEQMWGWFWMKSGIDFGQELGCG